MRVVHQVLPPAVQHGQKADLCTQVLGVGGNPGQSLGNRPKQDIVDHDLVLESDDGDLLDARERDYDQSGDWGIDGKIGVASSLTLDLTYNTDFAQVEVDEQQINLTRFPLFFPEKREFFLESRGIFDFGRPAGVSR